MKRFLLILLLSVSVFAGGQKQVFILQTTDVHGNIYPHNYFTDQPADNGLAKVYSLVKEFRKKHQNVILVDTGDLIQGTPMIYLFNHQKNSFPNPMILTMNYMRYDAFAVGNHDIEQGFLTYYKAMRESDFPWLSANSNLEDGSTYFKPYTIIEKNGIKIGLVGLTTPAIPMWLNENLYPGISWGDMVETAARYAQLLRPQVDILIGLFHAGMNEDYSSKHTDALGIPNENAARLVAEKVTGYDAIFCGHAHRVFPEEDQAALVNNTVMVMAGSHARYLGVAEFDLRDSEIVKRNGYVLPVADSPAAPEILAINETFHTQTLAYIREVIGTVDDTISARNSRFKDTPLIELINRAQMEVTGAPISFAASFNDRFILYPGPVKVKDIYGIYRYENFLYVIEMSGRQIKDYLEFCSEYFVNDNGKIKVNKEMAGYNYDMAEGLVYQINMNEKAGSRVKNLRLINGEPLIADAKYKVAMNSYRASGGGGHLGAVGIKTANVLWKSNQEMRNILIEYIRKSGGIETKTDNNWELVF